MFFSDLFLRFLLRAEGRGRENVYSALRPACFCPWLAAARPLFRLACRDVLEYREGANAQHSHLGFTDTQKKVARTVRGWGKRKGEEDRDGVNDGLTIEKWWSGRQW